MRRPPGYAGLLGGVFENPIGLDIKVAELHPGRLVRWEAISGPPEWAGTTIRWDLRQDGDWTIVTAEPLAPHPYA